MRCLDTTSTAEEEKLYTRLLEHYPEASSFRRLRGYCRVQLGKWDAAAADFAQATQQWPDGIVFLHASNALLSLHEGRVEDYQQECKWLVEFLSKKPRISERYKTAMIACLVSPSTGLDEESLYRLAGGDSLTRGIAAYRSGKHAEAVDLLRSQRDKYRMALPRLFEAMAQHRLGADDQAFAALADARALMEENCPRPGHPRVTADVSYWTSVVWCEAHIVQQEAEALIADVRLEQRRSDETE